MGESLPRLPVQNEHSEVCTSDRGQDSPIQTDLARLIRCLLYGQTRKQRNKNINNFICFPARAQAFSWLSSVTGLQSKRNKNNCLKSSFVQTLYKQANLFIFFVCNFLRRTVTTRSFQMAVWMGKTRPRSRSILANQILEFVCFQSF